MRPARHPSGAVLFVVLAFASSTAPATAQEFQVDMRAERIVRFVSRTSIDEFEGVTDKIDGYVLIDGPTLTTGVGGDDTELYLEVDLASIDTGIGLRNRHMRDNYLEVERYPFASYRGSIVSVASGPEGAFRVATRGEMTIHGVTRAMEIPCEVVAEGRGYRTRCTFPVLLSDHQIEIPSIMFLKLANEIRLELDFVMAPVGNGGPQ
jgi:polyisoprenoid-binding protein YceI